MNAAADLQKAIPPVGAIQITLPTAQDALAYQALNGGWAFVVTSGRLDARLNIPTL